MKATRLIALLVAAFFVLAAPVAATAATYPGQPGGTSNQPPTPSGDGCFTTEYTVSGDPGEQLTLTVRNSDDEVVYRETKTANADGDAFFSVRLCEPGTYTGTGTDSDGNVLGTSQFTIPRGDGAGPKDDDGNLPNTGSDTRSMLALGGGLALLVVGGVTMVAARRRSA